MHNSCFPFWGVWAHWYLTYWCSPRKSKYAKQFTTIVFSARFDAGRYWCGLWRYWHSVLYSMQTVFHFNHLPVTPANVYGIVSLFFWTLTLLVAVKYVLH